MVQFARIKFSHNYSKLSERLFTTVRLYTPDRFKYYLDNNEYNIVVKGILRCQTHKMGIRLFKLGKITEAECQFDADMTRDDFIELMTRFYSKKPEWKGLNTIMMMIFLIRK